MQHFYFFLCFALLGATPLLAQKDTKPDKAIKAVINRFFEGLEKGDSTLLRSACTEAPVLQTYMKDKEGQLKVFTEDFDEFVAFISVPSKDQYKEAIEFEAIHAEETLASVWTPYTFYINGKVSHSGTNAFQLVKTAEGWKIQYILDTRRKPVQK